MGLHKYVFFVVGKGCNITKDVLFWVAFFDWNRDDKLVKTYLEKLEKQSYSVALATKICYSIHYRKNFQKNFWMILLLKLFPPL